MRYKSPIHEAAGQSIEGKVPSAARGSESENYSVLNVWRVRVMLTAGMKMKIECLKADGNT